MIDISKGRYWDLPWSLVDGCTPCSPGCEHCWSQDMTARFGGKGRLCDEEGNPHIIEGGKFTGEIMAHPERLSIPLRRRKPTVYSIWNDWCHEGVDHVFRHKMVLKAEFSEQHTFLALTKRPKIMLDFWKSGIQHVPWNWWNGLTVCYQAEADAKIVEFLKVPGRKFLSIEPMLGPIDFSYNHFCGLMGWGPPDPPRQGETREERLKAQSRWVLGKIGAVVLGGETGTGARPMHPDWVRSVRDQCQAAGVPFFFKRWGEYGPSPDAGLPDNLPSSAGYYFQAPDPPGKVWKFGRKTAGRLLDGRTHDELPWGMK